MIRLVAQVLPGGVHQFEGVADAVAGELAVALDDVAANDHRLEKLEHVAAGHGIVLLPLSTAVFYTRPGVAHSHVSDIPPNQVCLAWDATRRSRLIRDFAAIAADHPPVASRAEPGCVSPG